MSSVDQRIQRMPLYTPDTVLDSVYSGKTLEKDFPEFEAVMKNNRDFDPEKFMVSLTQPDEATAVLYKQAPNGKVEFPYTDKHTPGDGIRIYEGNIGEMSGYGHKENLTQNAQSIVAKLSTGIYPGVNKRAVELMGLFANSGKKYTARTSTTPQLKDMATQKKLDPRGQTIFPMSNAVSSYIAARTFKEIGLSKEEARPLIAAIHAKDQAPIWEKEVKKMDEDGFVIGHSPSKENFIEKYGSVAATLTEALYKADAGYGDRMKLMDGRHTFAKGQAIISSDLVRYVKEHPDRAPRAEKMAVTSKSVANQHHIGVAQVSLQPTVQEKTNPNQAYIIAHEENARRLQREYELKEYEREQEALKKMEDEKEAAAKELLSTAVNTGIILGAAASFVSSMERMARQEDINSDTYPEQGSREKKGLTKVAKEDRTEKQSSLNAALNGKQQKHFLPIVGKKKEKKKQDKDKKSRRKDRDVLNR